jgi:hypothetical protein
MDEHTWNWSHSYPHDLMKLHCPRQVSCALLGRDILLKCSPLLYFPVVSSCYKESSMATTARHCMVHLVLLPPGAWCEPSAPALFFPVARALWCEHLTLVANPFTPVFTRNPWTCLWADAALALAMGAQGLDLFCFAMFRSARALGAVPIFSHTILS